MRIISQPWFVLLYTIFHISCNIFFCIGGNNITVGQSISGNQTLISENGLFELGFFTPSKTSNKSYIGIWYKDQPIRTVVWIANRQNGTTDPYSEFILTESGYRIQNQSRVYWSWLYDNGTYHRDAVAVLHDDGNFVIYWNGSATMYYQSYNDLTDTWLPRSKIGKTECENRNDLISWKSADDPSKGSFRLHVEADTNLVIQKEPTHSSYAYLNWSGNSQELNSMHTSYNKYITFSFVWNDDMIYGESYFSYSVHNPSVPIRFVLDPLGNLQLFIWKEDFRKWELASQHSEQRNSRGETKTGLLIVLTVIATVILLSVLLVYILKIIRKRECSVSLGEGSITSYKYRDLKRSTMNFSQELGRGGFGAVYRGTMSDSTLVAVKKLECSAGEKQFRSEVNTVGLIQHVNLIRLLGFCAEGSKRLLVYEYMANGSLSTYLFGRDTTLLDWNMRYQIALGIAQGLQYLHEKCRDCIIHCDIKPENILLDASLNAKVADFGLAKLLGRNFSRVLTTMRGTRGYLAPEWISGVAITPKADVYSYGMVLFEIISGRRNLDMDNNEMVNYFPARAVKITSREEEVMSLLDPRLEGNVNVKELTRACRVACWCIQDAEGNRPSMGQIVQVLQGLSEIGISPVPSFLKVILDGSTSPSAVIQSNDSASLQDESSGTNGSLSTQFE